MNKVIIVLFILAIIDLFVYEAYCRRCNVCEIYGKAYSIVEDKCVRIEGADNE